ncbi:MAG: ImmA/IrrE family metallo-endopeptidase [Armatimonadota bacterium]|nr:ImmA/IrrE family metallo-endopeptidase [Armatimonadota bacterium]MDR7428008.1 ImmA/IrrE family metallo-endopeptidase [Armatimonadota bacterium]MDR7465247.1 ImmA/IrrE family metallo-endopeptidase [Armatimonadota bacterium]MDR7470782.1 ImmA/IrrE family metallo-endopeptidase [Armatimonadota bacterium]MDR7475645.1 ImmA/IrrE family metallo-endopeptidase [Armatimonadota bacterium]
MRWCLLCGDEMMPEFGSPCEDPVAWTCRACGFYQLETGGRPFSGEQLAAVRRLPGKPAEGEAPTLPPEVRAAREILATFGLTPPVDVERVAALLGYPVEWVRRPASERGGIARRAGRETLVLNRAYPFRSAAERRWVVAEELGHAVLGHTALAASTTAEGPAALREPLRTQEERAGKAFAAELLMPAAEVRAEFRRMQPRLRRAAGRHQRAELLQGIVTDLAHTFQVSPAAMRRRLEDLGLLR